MKKQLLCTSAIALGCAMAAPASAQEWDPGLGGFMNQHFAYASNSGSALVGGDFDGADVFSNTEIIFSPRITLDNGITFGANVQLEGNTSGDQIDESYMSISGDTLGRILIGSENSAGYGSMVAAPTVDSMSINSPSISVFTPRFLVYPGGFRTAALSSYTEVAGNNDADRLTYYSPRFNGLQIGVSYARDPGQDNAILMGNKNVPFSLNDIFDIGVNYSQSFGSTDVTLSARYGTGEVAPTIPAIGDPETWAIGAQFGFSGFVVGGAYAENDTGIIAGLGDSEGISLGASYDVGNGWTVGAEGYMGEITGLGGFDPEYNVYEISGSKALGPGVSWDLYLTRVEADNGLPGVFNADTDGTVFGTAVNLSF
ncbi:porin [Roseovarius salinarum]|uniref:porin n=1 Tax=Roseovarius salinarum TaxID=1981892 RepID=UPI001E51672E|nr:porin [Roseovarius salinarum]